MERPAKMGLSSKDIKKRAQKRRDRNRPATVRNNHRGKALFNYHAKKQRKSLETIDALAAAETAAEKRTAEESKQSEPALFQSPPGMVSP